MSKSKKIVYDSEESYEDSFEKSEHSKKTKQLKQKLEDCQKLKEEYLTGWQKASADLINFRRRQEDNQGSIQRQNQAVVILEILPVLDSLNQVTGDKNITAVLQQLMAVLKSLGLKEIKAQGEIFDPQIHEAIEQIKSKEKSGTIVAEIQKGYLLHNQLLRPTKVKVSK